MLIKFLSWQYRPDRNCWDYVREFLIDIAKIPISDVPKYGIPPSDKKRMTLAAKDVSVNFYNTEPCDFAVACHYIGETILHVGVVYNGYVWHTSSQWGTARHKLDKFEGMAQKTVYKIHGSLRHI